MIFTDGAWRIAEGFDIHPAREVRFVRADNDKVTLTNPTFNISVKGQTLSGPYVTVEITSPAPNIFRIRTYHFKGDNSLAPSYFDISAKTIAINTSEDEKSITVKSGESVLEISKENYGYILKRNGRVITSSEGGALAYIDGDNGSFMREQLSLQVGEHVYGLGERFGNFIRNGQSIDIVNKDGRAVL